MTSTDTYQLKWHSHSSHLNGSVAALLRSERFTDVVLCTLDGSQIPAHKFILSSCSVYLCNLFEGQRSVTRMGGMLYVVLPSEISTKALKILVEYMYKERNRKMESNDKTNKKKISKKKIEENSAAYIRQKEKAKARKQKFLDNMTTEQKEIKKAKDREYYHKKKVEKKIKSITDMTEREKWKLRKEWKKNSKKYRLKKKSLANTLNNPDAAPPDSENENIPSVRSSHKSETTVSNEVLDTVLKAGEVLKIRGLWRQTEDGSDGSAEKTATQTIATTSVMKAGLTKKPDEIPIQPKIAVRKDDKLLKAFNSGQPGQRPMFIGPPKLVFIKTTEGGTQAAIRPGGPKGQTILVAPAPTPTEPIANVAATTTATATAATSTPAPTTVTVATTTAPTTVPSEDSSDEPLTPRILRRHAERKYGKRQKTETKSDNEETKDLEEGQDNASEGSKKSSQSLMETEVQIKDEPEWDASSIEEEERSIAEMFQAEMSVKNEPNDEVDIEEESLIYSPLACELCAEVFTVPAAWVRHVQGHARDHTQHARKRKLRSASDDTEETTALLKCDLCMKHFPNPAEWVRHIQSTHTESELAMSNNSAPPKRHNRFTEGAQNKNCSQCKKSFPSHASMLIHMRTHTGERPFICGLCNKGFNVKSNLLRHLRTLHDQLISPAQVEEGDEEDVEPGPSEVKRES